MTHTLPASGLVATAHSWQHAGIICCCLCIGLRYTALLLQYYFSPSGQRFRSRQEIMRHLGTGRAEQTKTVLQAEGNSWLNLAIRKRQGQSGDSHSQAGSKQEQQGLAQPRVDAASDSSQGQGGAAPAQLPAAPLFVAQSPAGKSQADEWVKKHLAMHPEKSEEEALRGA